MKSEEVDILFLSEIIPNELKQEVNSKSHKTMSDAAIELQWKIIKGIEANINSSITIYNLMPVYSYPKYYDDSFIKTSEFHHNNGSNDLNLGFFNMKYIKHMFLDISIRKHILKWAGNDSGRKKILISYTINKTFMKAIKLAKTKNESIISTAIIADLPEYSNLSEKQGLARRTYINWEANYVRKLMQFIDSYVLLTKQMVEKLGINKPYVIVEGISTDIFPVNNFEPDPNLKYILYAGTLHEKFGILKLLEAFRLIADSKYRLIICGIGDSEEKVVDNAKQDGRILFMGQLPRDKVLDIIAKTTVIVNPRENNEEFTKYSFPSKNLEALSSGVPLVAYKLSGIPDEYDQFINYVEGNTAQDLANKLVEICEKSTDELRDMGNKARLFVMEYKNNIVQTKKILDMIDKINN